MVSIASLNFDSNMRRERGIGGKCFPELRMNERVRQFLPILRKFLEDAKPDIMCFQELRKHSLQADSFTPVAECLLAAGYSVYWQLYDNNDTTRTGFGYITALRKATVGLNFGNSGRVYMTTSPRVHTPADMITANPSICFGEKEERSVQVLHLYIENDSGFKRWFSVINAHMQMSLEARLGSAWALASYIRNIKHPIVMVGDFNSFADCGGDEQVRIICQEGGVCDLPIMAPVTDATGDEPGQWQTWVQTCSTFVSFVDDLVGGISKSDEDALATLGSMPEKQRCGFFPPHMARDRIRIKGSVLDHVFVRFFVPTKSEDVTLNLLPLDPSIAPTNLEDDADIQKYVRIMAERKTAPFVSDHQLVFAKLQFCP